MQIARTRQSTILRSGIDWCEVNEYLVSIGVFVWQWIHVGKCYSKYYTVPILLEI